MALIAASDGNPEIYLMNSDGTGQLRLTHTKADEITPEFSADGHSLFFAANRIGKFAIYQLSLPWILFLIMTDKQWLELLIGFELAPASQFH